MSENMSGANHEISREELAMAAEVARRTPRSTDGLRTIMGEKGIYAVVGIDHSIKYPDDGDDTAANPSNSIT